LLEHPKYWEQISIIVFILSTKKMINGELHTDTERSRSMIFEKQ
jgi:hypothetical protein